METIVDNDPLTPTEIALDVDRGKIYWTYAGPRDGSGRGIGRANLDGSNVESIVTGPGIARLGIDVVSGRLYYFDGRNLIRRGLDDPSETRLCVEQFPGSLHIVPEMKSAFWPTDQYLVRRADLDGKDARNAVDVGKGFGHIRYIAIDERAKAIYWTNESYGHICRSSMDGSQVEQIVTGIVTPTGLAVDADAQWLYWMESFADEGGVGNVRLRRIHVPKKLACRKTPAPPLVTAIAPDEQVPGGEILLSGARLAGTSNSR